MAGNAQGLLAVAVEAEHALVALSHLDRGRLHAVALDVDLESHSRRRCSVVQPGFVQTNPGEDDEQPCHQAAGPDHPSNPHRGETIAPNGSFFVYGWTRARTLL